MDLINLGTDTSGRPIRASRVFAEWWADYCERLGFAPTIVQGGWQGGAGASASAGTHEGDAFDLRLWDRTASERAAMIREARSTAVAYWERYPEQGFDLHAHLIPGSWAHPAPQALDQWRAYVAGRNGLASNGPDYHWRPSPLVTEPPEDEVTENDLDKIRAIIREELSALLRKDLYPRLKNVELTVADALKGKPKLQAD